MTEQTRGFAAESEPLTSVHVQLSGRNGNAWAIMGAVIKGLKSIGRQDLVQPFTDEAKSGDYDHLLQTAMKYVEVY